MNALLDFTKAAAPWVITGIALAVFLARSAAKETRRGNQEKTPPGDYGSEGMCFGMCFGVAIASALKGSIAIWLSLGLLAGLVIGSRIPKNEDSNP